MSLTLYLVFLHYFIRFATIITHCLRRFKASLKWAQNSCKDNASILQIKARNVWFHSRTGYLHSCSVGKNYSQIGHLLRASNYQNTNVSYGG